MNDRQQRREQQRLAAQGQQTVAQQPPAELPVAESTTATTEEIASGDTQSALSDPSDTGGSPGGTDPSPPDPVDSPVLPGPDSAAIGEGDEAVDPRQDQASRMRTMGFLKALEQVPGPDAHAIHQRLCECLPFVQGAADAAEPINELVADALEQFEQFLRGS